jgi:diguanylate cyclase (GGDEF)-like protein
VSESEITAFRHQRSADGKSQISIYENQRGNGDMFWVELHVSFDHIREHGEVAIIVARDISDHITRQRELTATSAKLSHLAATDSLTGLANRLNVMGKMSRALTRPLGQNRGVGLLEIDADHFKTINDSFGHSAGDEILKKLARTLQCVVSKDDIAARIGGDEFLVLCPNVQSLDEIEEIGQQIIALNDDPLCINGMTLHCGLSIGAAFADEDGLSPEDLLRRADFALYEAKNAGRGRVATYDKSLHARQVAQARLGEELSAAVENDAISFHFQPIMDLKTGAIRSFETLVRWKNPRLGFISPADFLPLAKSLGLMAALDFAALRAALDLKAVLNQSGHPAIRVGFNGSAELLGHPHFYDTLTVELAIRQLSPKDILIEVLETVVFDDISKSNPLVQTVQRLHDAGFTTLLDDFGTGHAGLTHLATLAVDGVKIDRSLTENILTDPTSAKIVSMVFELCRDLDLYAVTEGVETTQQAQALVNMGGTAMHGNSVAKAMPASNVPAWLANRDNIVSQITLSPIAAAASPRY